MKPEKAMEQVALAAREIATIVRELPVTDPTGASVLQRVADLAQGIERTSTQIGNGQSLDLVEIIRVISAISGFLSMLSLLHR